MKRKSKKEKKDTLGRLQACLSSRQLQSLENRRDGEIGECAGV